MKLHHVYGKRKYHQEYRDTSEVSYRVSFQTFVVKLVARPFAAMVASAAAVLETKVAAAGFPIYKLHIKFLLTYRVVAYELTFSYAANGLTLLRIFVLFNIWIIFIRRAVVNCYI